MWTYARARYYKPEIGRFISEDPYEGELWEPQGQNLYAYVLNNPLRYVDPSGYYCESADRVYRHMGNCELDTSTFYPDEIGQTIISLGEVWFSVENEKEKQRLHEQADVLRNMWANVKYYPVINRNMTKSQFVSVLYNEALAEQVKSRVPAAITTSQAILETGYGRGVPIDKVTGRYSYNLFGIKGAGPAGSVVVRTHEYVDGRKVYIDANFAAYHNFTESISERSKLLSKKRYRSLFSTSDPIEWAYGLQRAGYATDPQYANKLIKIIDYWGLK